MTKANNQVLTACATPVAGWQAKLDLQFQRLQQRTVLRHSHSGPLRVQRPFYPEGQVCHVYLVHPPAGVVGGDDLRIRVHTAEQSGALITTPGATQFYRSAGEQATVHQHITLDTDSHLDWLPQENIYFDGAVVEASNVVRLQENASFIGWDMHCFGRPAANERFLSGRVCINQRIERNGVPVLRERLVVQAPQRIDAVSGLRGNAVCATLYATPVSKQQLVDARQSLQAGGQLVTENIALTLIDDLLIARYLGPSTQQARQLFQHLWQILRPEVHHLPACAPRIWAT